MANLGADSEIPHDDLHKQVPHSLFFHFLQVILAESIVITSMALTAPECQAQKYTVIHAFTGARDGEFPGAVTLDAAGDIYGVAGGGTYGGGVIFEMNPSGQEIVLYNFQGSQQEKTISAPHGPLLRGTDGSLYGTTVFGGNPSSSGTAFALSRSGRLKVWRDLPGEPYAGLITDSQGNLYGTTGGSVFEVSNNQVQTLYNFPDGTAALCVAPLLRDAGGNLYGTTQYGGTYNLGTVFKMDPSAP